MPKISFLSVLLSLLISSSAHASTSTFTGKVINVADGDTITILTQSDEKIKIRLAGIDCPESFQVHGEKAKQYLSSLVDGKRVRIEPQTVDKYGRTVGMVLVNGANINEQIVSNGHGWVFRKYCTAGYCKEWLKLEEKARKAWAGLWQDANPQPPWEWRAEQKSRESSGNVSPPAVVATRTVAASKGGGSSTVYHGNTRSQVFHGPSCKDYTCKNCTVVLGSVQEAVRAGYRAHRECVKE
ncbi:MAG: thermonuclease family protein [Desulfobulbaceae bacterium]|nr:thermonuclease family protein [Desulfobulbaceae bacterium]